jgi:hypothetical protein
LGGRESYDYAINCIKQLEEKIKVSQGGSAERPPAN